MVGTTKEVSVATRERILDAAVQVFVEHGLSAASLDQVAISAGLTRGAVQWHFGDKEHLVNALMTERAIEPMGKALARLELALADVADPLHRLKAQVAAVLKAIEGRPQVRSIAELAMLKAESCSRTDAVHQLRLECMADWARRLAGCIAHAQRMDLLPAAVNARATGMMICAMLHALIRSWLLEPHSFDLLAQGRQMVGVFLDGLKMRAAGQNNGRMALV